MPCPAYPLLKNSCPVGWGNATLNGVVVKCRGTTAIAGTGRWKLATNVLNQTINYETMEPDLSPLTGIDVSFKRFDAHWDAYSGADGVDFVNVKYYATEAEVNTALTNGNLDAVIGDGVLTPEHVAAYKSNTNFYVAMTEPLQNRIVVLNTDKAPTNSLQTRKVIIHAVDKSAIIDKELAGLDEPVDQLFSKRAPYCHVDLTPKWDYDIEKAQLLNCPTSDDDDIPTGLIAAVAVCGAAVVGLVTMISYMRFKEQQGKPLFSPLVQYDEGGGAHDL